MVANDPPTEALAPQRVVLDTNVSLALWLFNDPALHSLRAELENGRLLWVSSRPMLDELWHEALRPERLGRLGLTEHALREVLAAVPCEHVTDPVGPADGINGLRCTDPADQVFIDVALAQRVPWLLSRDKAVLKLHRRARLRGLSIVPPEKWSLAQQAVGG